MCPLFHTQHKHTSLIRSLALSLFSFLTLIIPFLMLVGDQSNSSSSSSSHRSYIPSLIPPGVDPAKVDSKMFYTYVPNTIKTRKRTTPSQLEILENVFVTDKKPNAPKRKDLAKKLKMSPREVQVRAPSSLSLLSLRKEKKN
jgi:Homeodomain